MINAPVRGENSLRIKEENRRRIIDYFRRNPKGTQIACANKLGLSPKTVGNHIMAIRKEEHDAKA